MSRFLRPAVSVVLFFFVLLSLVLATAGFAQVDARTKVGTGIYRGHRVTFQIVKGKPIYQGDIALDHVSQKMSDSAATPGGTLAYLQNLWPKVGTVYQIPYTIDPASGDVDNINAAITQYNSIFSGLIQWVPHTTEADWINFDLDPNDTSGQGNSYIGRVGGEQPIWGSGSATVATMMHEMGHATGLWHEQSRPDRDGYVAVNFNNIISVLDSDSEVQLDDMQTVTLYDWSSIMHYGAFTYTRNGAPTIETIPAGMPLSNNAGYSAGDMDAIRRLYKSAPTKVTVTTNPSGLQVIVDGATVTAPHVFTWPINSVHTLAVSGNAQTLTGNSYTYGRWNDNGAVSHSITVLPGNGDVALPATSPAVTVYTASFIQLVPYTMAVFPANTGTVAPTPAPQSYPGVSGLYYTARQLVTLTATPSSGQNFYEYINSPFWLPGGLSSNPKTFYVTDDGTPINTVAYFSPTTFPIYTLGSIPQDSRFYVIADGGYWPSPKSFTPFYDSTWTSGSTHSVAVDPTQWPWTFNSRYLFDTWSDGGAQSHNVVLPSTSTVYTATLAPQYYLSEYANQGCAGTISVTPTSPTSDSFYPTGTLLTFSQTPATGWAFTEWQHDLTGASSPQSITMNDELFVTADYSTTSTPLTLTSLTPSGATAGATALTLAINGTGFTSGTIIFVNNTFRTSTFVNANKITVPLTTADLATPGAYQLFVENFPTGAACSTYTALPFTVANAPLVKPTPESLAFTAQLIGTVSAAKSVTVKNSRTAPVTFSSISVSGNYIVSSTTCGATLAGNASCAVSVAFSPQTAGAIGGALTIADNSPDSPQVIPITGTGTLPLTTTPATLAFGSVAVGTTSPAKVISVTNNETFTLALTIAASGNYAISPTGTTCTGSLASKAKCNIAVTFTPTAASTAINGSVSITDVSGFSPQLISLSGAGTGGSAAPLTFAPASLTFTTQANGTTSAAKAVTVKNVSASTVTLSAITASSEFSATGSGTTPCNAGGTLAAGRSCALSATFSPALGSSGAISGAVAFTDNAPVAQQVLSLKGTAALPVTFAPLTLTFPAQTVATASTPQIVTITNNLATTMSPVIAGSGNFAVAPGGATPCTSTLNAHASCTVSVTFTPSGIGNRAGALTVTDSGNPTVQSMGLTGTGQ